MLFRSPLDKAVALFFKGVAPAEFELDRVLSLWRFFDISFEGFSMINGADGAEQMEWLYGLDSVASYLKAVSSVCHESRFELLWRFPVALGAHLIAAACRDNPQLKVYRKPDKAHRDRLAAYGVNTEGVGKLTYWQKMWPDRYDLSEVQVIRGGDALAKEFNALSAAQRQAKIDDALKRYQPMIDAYANTWEAITSTTVSYGKDLLRLATNPFFHVAKKELRSMNDWWGQNEKGIREYANGVGTLLVGAYKTARREAGVYFDRVDAFVRSDTAQRLWSFGERAASMASNLAGRAWGAVTESPGATASGVGMAAGVAMGIPGLGLVLGGLVQFATHTEAADAVMSSLGDTAGSVAAILGTLWPLFEQVEVGLGDVFASLLPGLAAGLAGAAEGLQQFIAEAGPGVGELIDAVRPIVEMLGGILGELAREIGTDTIERLHDLGVGVGALASVIAELIASLQLREAPALGTLRNAPRDGAHGQGIAERLNTFLERIRQPLTAQQRAELGARGGARREVGHPGRTVVNVQIHQTVNTNDDPDRVLLMTRRAVYQGLHAPLQSPGVRVTH